MNLTFLAIDAAAALDYFAILQVKSERGLDVKSETERVECCLRLQHPELDHILASPEYHRLYCANRSVFDAVDKAWSDAIKASAVQQVNQLRFKAKVALQKRFWPEQPLAERKSQPSTHV